MKTDNPPGLNASHPDADDTDGAGDADPDTEQVLLLEIRKLRMPTEPNNDGQISPEKNICVWG